MQGNSLVLACSFGAGPAAAESGRKTALTALSKGSPMRSCDSDHSTASVISMSESGSDRSVSYSGSLPNLACCLIWLAAYLGSLPPMP